MRRLDILDLDAPQDGMPSACVTSGCTGPDPAAAEPFEIGGEVIVAGRLIEEEAIAREMQHHPAPSAEEAWLLAARALAVRELLLVEAGALAEDADHEDAIQQLLEERIHPATPNEAECRRAYDADPGNFTTPELIEASHILIEPQEDHRGGWRRAEILAEKLIAELQGKDEKAFASAAREHSACPSAKQDGSLGQLARGELAPEVEEPLMALREGEMAQRPVRSKHGWHLLRLHRRVPGRQLPFEMVAERIGDMLEARSWSLEAARFIADLARVHGVSGIDFGEAAR